MRWIGVLFFVSLFVRFYHESGVFVTDIVKASKSKWSDTKMSGFSKYVGFLIDDFEEECLALFMHIEESREL